MSEAESVVVHCEPHGLGWECRVYVGSEDEGVEYLVTVSRAELDHFAHGHYEPTALVEASFGYLLEREPKESILRKFAIGEIERYFPNYRAEIGPRL